MVNAYPIDHVLRHIALSRGQVRYLDVGRIMLVNSSEEHLYTDDCGINHVGKTDISMSMHISHRAKDHTETQGLIPTAEHGEPDGPKSFVFTWGVWPLTLCKEKVQKHAGDPKVRAFTCNGVRSVLATLERHFFSDGFNMTEFNQLDPVERQLITEGLCIAVAKGILHQPSSVPPLSEDEVYFCLTYNCPECHYVWQDYWDSHVESECPRCLKRSLMPVSHVELSIYPTGSRSVAPSEPDEFGSR